VFNVKWQGYDDPKDQTWEPEANMYVEYITNA
jgi:chromobox protein 1